MIAEKWILRVPPTTAFLKSNGKYIEKPTTSKNKLKFTDIGDQAALYITKREDIEKPKIENNEDYNPSDFTDKPIKETDLMKATFYEVFIPKTTIFINKKGENITDDSVIMDYIGQTKINVKNKQRSLIIEYEEGINKPYIIENKKYNIKNYFKTREEKMIEKNQKNKDEEDKYYIPWVTRFNKDILEASKNNDDLKLQLLRGKFNKKNIDSRIRYIFEYGKYYYLLAPKYNLEREIKINKSYEKEAKEYEEALKLLRYDKKEIEKRLQKFINDKSDKYYDDKSFEFMLERKYNDITSNKLNKKEILLEILKIKTLFYYNKDYRKFSNNEYYQRIINYGPKNIDNLIKSYKSDSEAKIRLLEDTQDLLDEISNYKVVSIKNKKLNKALNLLDKIEEKVTGKPNNRRLLLKTEKLRDEIENKKLVNIKPLSQNLEDIKILIEKLSTIINK